MDPRPETICEGDNAYDATERRCVAGNTALPVDGLEVALATSAGFVLCSHRFSCLLFGDFVVPLAEPTAHRFAIHGCPKVRIPSRAFWHPGLNVFKFLPMHLDAFRRTADNHTDPRAPTREVEVTPIERKSRQ